MPICIECRYPVPQLYHVLHSSNSSHKSSASALPRAPRSPSHEAVSASVGVGGAGENDFSRHTRQSVTVATTSTRPVHDRNRNVGRDEIGRGVNTGRESTEILGKRKAGGSGGGGGGGGGDVRLTQCPRCRRFADKYVEHDFVVLFIDLVLVKPQVYRHLLFNRLGRDDDELDPSITRLGILLLLFDVYLTWRHIESLPAAQTASSPIPTLPTILQYAFYLLLSILSSVAQHLVVRWLAAKWIVRDSSFASASATPIGPPSHPPPFITTTSTSPPLSPSITSPSPPPPPPSTTTTTTATTTLPPTPSAISTALFVSSNMKLFPLLMVVWKYDDPTHAIYKGVEWAVAVQNIEALRILLACGYWIAAALVGAGWVAGWAVGALVRSAVGLGV